MARVIIVLSRDEVRKTICYPMICETMYGSRWGTQKRRRTWLSEFTEEERKACGKLKSQAYGWYCGRGVPDEVKMYSHTLSLWRKLEAFCASL